MKYKIIAATGCPTGVAHTFMAQEKLEQAAKAKGVTIKVETHGQIGVENELTPEEISQADVVIIAADKDVNDERFVGKKIIDVPVIQGIKNADHLIQDAPIDDEDKTIKNNENINQVKDLNIGSKLYRHLMNGVSHMLPFVVSGGVLIAISFLWGIYSADPSSDQYNLIAAKLNEVGGVSMGLMTPIFAAFIAQSVGKRPALAPGFVAGMISHAGGAGFLGGLIGGFIAGYVIKFLEKASRKLPKSLDGLKAIFILPVISVLIVGSIMVVLVAPMNAINETMMNFLASFEDSNPVLLGLIVGMMCAFDFGGPVNKAAYVTGTVLLGQGNYSFMAGVSAACIAPPLVTTVAVLLFKDKFTQDERNAGLVNAILGSTHITEGAIPFAAKDPLKAIPSFMLGSSIAAILTYLFKVQVPAPHGGFLVLPVVTHPIQWVIAILIGSIIGGIALGLTRKKLS